MAAIVGHRGATDPPGTNGKSRLARHLFRSFNARNDIEIALANGGRLLVPNLSEPIAFHCLSDSEYEPDTAAILRRFLHRDGTFLDVGANIGVFSLAAARHVGPNGRVIAVEASPTVFPYLEHNIELNGAKNITVVQTAITAEGPGIRQFWQAPAKSFGMGALAPQFDARPVDVKCNSLDNICADLDIHTVDLVKIDIEGFEKFAFQGGKSLLTSAKPPPIIFEFADWAETRTGLRTGDAQRLLLEYGYTLMSTEGLRLRRIDQVLTTGAANILALPPGHPAEG